MRCHSLIALTAVGAAASLAGAQFVDHCAEAPTVGPGLYAYDLHGATNDVAGACGATATAPDAWVKFLPIVTGTAAATTCNLAAHDTVLAVHPSCGGKEYASLDDSCGLQTSLEFHVTAGVPVWIRIAGFNGGVGSGSVEILTPIPASPQTWNEAADAGSLPQDAQTPLGAGPLYAISGFIPYSGDVDMYLINVCDAAAFAATSINPATPRDTQLFVFTKDGIGVYFNDDDPAGTGGLRATLHPGFLSENGDYYLAVARYNCDPLDKEGKPLWLNEPFRASRAPDGPGADNHVASWSSTPGRGPYTVYLAGACFPSAGRSCDPDYNRDGVADQEDIAFLRDIIAGKPNTSGLDPDFNRDGVADQDDVASLINVVAGGDCP